MRSARSFLTVLAPVVLVAATALVGSLFERSTEIYFINALVAVSLRSDPPPTSCPELAATTTPTRTSSPTGASSAHRTGPRAPVWDLDTSSL